MVYRIFAFVAGLVVRTFFRRVDVSGDEHVPPDGPVIFAGNHPNALMDGFVIMAKCGRSPVHFMAGAKLWGYPGLRWLLDGLGAVPVYSRDAQQGRGDNEAAFRRLFEVLEAGGCIGIFPEGVSHTESRLLKFKTGTARIAVSASDRGKARVRIVPCGLTYLHRHRFRSQALLEFGAPIVIDDEWLNAYRQNEADTVRKLTDRLQLELSLVTFNAPDWKTVRFAQAARRIYKPAGVRLTPEQYVELNRRFVNGYLSAADRPEVVAFREGVENYQARLDMLGIRDHQVMHAPKLAWSVRKLAWRALLMLILLPVAIPGALLNLPIGWIAAIVGKRFSYEQDDIATLKVLVVLLLLPLVYALVAIAIGVAFGLGWGIAAGLFLPLSFVGAVKVMEAQTGLFMSALGILRLSRLDREVEDLRKIRAQLASDVREIAKRYSDPSVPRMFTAKDFRNT